jgi:hypothetical protein
MLVVLAASGELQMRALRKIPDSRDPEFKTGIRTELASFRSGRRHSEKRKGQDPRPGLSGKRIFQWIRI